MTPNSQSSPFNFFRGQMQGATHSLLRKTSIVLMTIMIGVGVFPGSMNAAAANPKFVTRGDFLRSAVSALRLPLERQGNVPYEGVSAALLPYVRTAQSKGALVAFSPSGSKLDLNKNITRGEAIWLLSRLAKLTPKNDRNPSFTDVKTPEAKNAVAIAIDRKWMRPLRAKLFGFDRELTKAEQRTLIRNVTRVKSVTIITPEPDTITINLSGQSSQSLPKKEILETVWTLLQKDFLYRDRLDPEEAAYRAAEALVQSLNDPYTTFMRPSSNKNFQTQIQGELTGIGAQVEQKAGALIVVAPLAGSPAEKAGLLAGDEIMKVNDESLAGLSYDESVNKVRGPKGSVAKLHIRRSGMEFDIAITRDVIRISDMQVSYQEDIAIVSLHQFGQVTDQKFRGEMEKVKAKNPKGIILDLRNNPGGLLHASEVVVSAFLPAGAIYAVIAANGETIEELTGSEPIFPENLKVIVLVNKGSASASEIVAGALQDAKRATLVGEKTFGKGTVQQVVEFNDGSSLKMTIAEWKTPKGRAIDGKGIEPDIAVAASTDRDTAMLRALDLLR